MYDISSEVLKSQNMDRAGDYDHVRLELKLKILSDIGLDTWIGVWIDKFGFSSDLATRIYMKWID